MIIIMIFVSSDGHSSCNTDQDILIKASPYLFPCVLEYSLLAAAVMFSMYTDVGIESASEETDEILPVPPMMHDKIELDDPESSFTTQINFHKSHKGMFAGLMVIAGTLVSIVLFFAYEETGEGTNLLIYHSTMIGLYGVVFIAVIIAIVQMHVLKFNRKLPRSVDDVMLGVAMAGFSFFQILKIIPLISFMYNTGYAPLNDILTLIECSLALLVGVEQTWFMIDSMRRTCKTEEQHMKKPGRGAVMFLLFTNVALWLFRTFHMKEVEVGGNLQEQEYGYLAWQLILHALVPLLIFYHFHSSACLAHIWSEAYQPPPPEPEPPKHLQKQDSDDDDSDAGLPQNQLTPKEVVQSRKPPRPRGRLPIPSVSEMVDESPYENSEGDSQPVSRMNLYNSRSDSNNNSKPNSYAEPNLNSYPGSHQNSHFSSSENSTHSPSHDNNNSHNNLHSDNNPQHPDPPSNYTPHPNSHSNSQPNLHSDSHFDCHPNKHNSSQKTHPNARSSSQPNILPGSNMDSHPDSHIPSSRSYSLGDAVVQAWKQETEAHVKKSVLKWKSKIGKSSSVHWQDQEDTSKSNRQVQLQNIKNTSTDQIHKSQSSPANISTTFQNGYSSPKLKAKTSDLNGSVAMTQDKEVQWENSDSDAASVTWQDTDSNPSVTFQLATDKDYKDSEL